MTERWTPDQYRAHFGGKPNQKSGVKPVPWLFQEEEQHAKKQGKKFGNKKKRHDGFVFDSKKEMTEYEYLKHQKAVGEIKDFVVKRKYTFVHNGYKIGSYTADFVKIHWDDREEVIDVKSPITAKDRLYRFKLHMMVAFFGINVVEKQ